MNKKLSYFLPGLGQSWLTLLVVLIIGSLVAGIAVIIGRFFPESDFINKTLVYCLEMIPAIIFAYLVGRSKMIQAEVTGNDIPHSPINSPNFGKMNPVLFFIVIAFAALAFPVFIDPISSLMKTPEWFEKIMGSMMGGNRLWTFVTVSLCAPLLEELICRGFICRGLLQHKSPTAAILWSAFIFAVMHLNPWQGLTAFILGAFFGWIYYKTRCLWATIFLHFMNNTLSTLFTFKFPEISSCDSLRDLLPDSSSYWMLFSVSVGVLALVFFLISKYIPSPKRIATVKVTENEVK